MKARDLAIPDEKIRRGAKEFNHLRVVNLDHFFASYACNFDYYSSPFKILSDLEEIIKYENKPDKTILVSYKPDGDVIFDLVEIEEKENLRVVKYEFATFIS